MRKRRPTQKDVAKQAGVSITTVSQVLNNRHGGNIRISEETRARVLAAIKDLGYTPNVSARSLRTQQTHLLALMVPDITNPFYPELIRGVQGTASRGGYDLLIYDADDRPEREKAFVDAILRRQVDGVAMIPFYLDRADMDRLHEANIAVATTIDRLAGPGTDNIVVDDHDALNAMMDLLIAKGHRQIAHIGGTLDTIPGAGRLDGYKQALQRANIPYDERLVYTGNFRADCVPAALDALFAPGHPAPTAIFAANDVMAIAAIYELIRRGYRVPEDVAVCGYDDIPEAGRIIPGLTTISQRIQETGQLLAQVLIDRLAGKTKLHVPDEQTPFAFKFIARDST